MSLTSLLLAELLLFTTVTASHFFGSLMTFNPRRNHDGLYKVELSFKATYHSCYEYDYWPCSSGDCGNDASTVIGQVDSSLNGNNWCQSEGVITKMLSTNSPFQLLIPTYNNLYNTCINHYNTFNNTYNNSYNNNHYNTFNNNHYNTFNNNHYNTFNNTYNNYYNKHDNTVNNHNDNHYATINNLNTYNNHCVTNNNHYNNHHITDDNHYTTSNHNNAYNNHNITNNNHNNTYRNHYITNDKQYVTETNHNNTFDNHVDGPAPSCTEGEYLPRFLHPTPHHGEHLQARVNEELEIRVKAFASFSRIIDVIISGPLNSTKYKTTTGEYVIYWTPTADNYGQHFPFCFIAEGQYGFDIYHSEMRCVVAKVNAEGPVAHVTCTQNSMSVTIERSSIKNLHGDHLRLINPSCRVYTNSTYVFTNTLLNECGTQIEENNNELFKNKIITFDDPRDIITRRNKLEIEILCKYQERTNVTLEFDTHRPPIIISEKGFGTFNYQFEFYVSENFHTSRGSESYPLEYDMGDKIYMKIEPVTPVLNTEIFLESCVATPYDNPNYPISYPIIKNGCNVDETVQFFSSHQQYVQFEMEAFKFIEFHDQQMVY
ncbi:glycosyltransferase-like protein gnt13 [Carassius carassius]|uniref:glycosyltransferase-like protein gnt13 n=1 Tax=Carassius carassius TaxID=217509 RepID=UPI0028685E06|nr:glycosyltransferase-like protein gnt13 [Carassius carassius]